MKILITFDYELFFGTNPGSVAKTILEPTEALIKICDKYEVRMSYFVDAGYLLKLKENAKKYLSCQNDYDLLIRQMAKLGEKRHNLQLHIHPHWEDTIYDGEKWVFDIKRYRLHSFTDAEISKIVRSYKNVLQDSCSEKVFVYRAGGWCIQPFDRLKKALKDNEIDVDSTVYHQGLNLGDSHYYDFREAPKKTYWRFSEDPLKEAEDGFFTEIPISTNYYSPLFYWQFAYHKKISGQAKHKILGDGNALQQFKNERIAKMLLKGDHNFVSTDGLKVVYLEKALKQYQSKFSASDYFVTLGHPKALTRFSLEKIDEFVLGSLKNNQFLTYQDLKKEKC